MSDTVISVENLGKKYIIGHQKQERYTALRDVIANGAKGLLKPFQRGKSQEDPSSEEFWALKDVSFEIKQGDRVGIIGRNGAGKSTLLKILSRITEPTEGRIRIRGRVASLLEVGTGFHPELTGRENIFLNGAILGMGREEIRRKFDEIVAFAEVEKFLDTPVKRYSSGMYVRLAFAVAAHLEPEILIVDEVLAVGDAQFQKKCLGKMEDVGKDGKTVLLVSHNMGSIQQLCNKSILLDRGFIKAEGKFTDVIEIYLRDSRKSEQKILKRQGNGKIIFDNFCLKDIHSEPSNVFFMGDTICLDFSLLFKQVILHPVIAIEIRNCFNESLAHIINHDDDFPVNFRECEKKTSIKVEIPHMFLTPGEYTISLWAGENMSITCDGIESCISFEIIQGEKLKRLTPYPKHVKTFIPSKWSENT
jgi:lipopolysaccharide transport system ATP-binding protein